VNGESVDYSNFWLIVHKGNDIQNSIIIKVRYMGETKRNNNNVRNGTVQYLWRMHMRSKCHSEKHNYQDFLLSL
jgi:hypothetical protein